MKKSFLLLLIANPLWLLSQNHFIDSLNIALSKATSQADQLRIRCEISQQWIEIGDSEKGKEMARDVLAEAKKAKDIRNMGLAFYSMGRLNQYEGYLKEALEFHYQAKVLFEETGADEYLAWTYLNIGITHKALDDLNKAIDFEFKALEIFKKLKLKKGIAYSYLNLGLAFNANEEYGRAIQQMLNAQNICRSINDAVGLGYTYHSLGEIYENMGDFDEAIKANVNCFPIKEQGNDKMGMALSCANLTSAYFKNGAIKKSQEELLKGERLAMQVNSPKALQKLYLIGARIDSLNGDFKGALIQYQKHIHYKNILQSEQHRGKVSELEHTIRVAEEKLASTQKPPQVEADGNDDDKEKTSILTLVLGGTSVLLGLILVLVLVKKRPRA